jgi:uncharacterized protein YjbI with pentapeptide repeats
MAYENAASRYVSPGFPQEGAMANPAHVELVLQARAAIDQWRAEHPNERLDLQEAALRGKDLHAKGLDGANLQGADLREANVFAAHLMGADLSRAKLDGANLRGANLASAHLDRARVVGANFRDANLVEAVFAWVDASDADFFRADLLGAFLNDAHFRRANLTEARLVDTRAMGTDFTGVDLTNAQLGGANLAGADFTGANLTGANLRLATLVETNLAGARLIGCDIYGISAWGVQLDGAVQKDLAITEEDSPILVDDLEVAQFLYLILYNPKLRQVIDTITSKVVLILGRFTPERKAVLDALREELRKTGRGYVPVIFDFEAPSSRNLTETVSTLAHMARFIIADLTDPRSIPQELQRIVPDLPSVPIQPLILEGQGPWGMFESFQSYPWVLPIHQYRDEASLIAALADAIIVPAEQKAQELRGDHTS